MKIHQSIDKILRNDYSGFVSGFTSNKTTITTMVGIDHENHFWIGAKVSMYMWNKDVNTEVYGHLSESRSNVINDNIDNSFTEIKAFIKGSFLNAEQEHYAHKPIDYPDVLFVCPDLDGLTQQMSHQLLSIGFPN